LLFTGVGFEQVLVLVEVQLVLQLEAADQADQPPRTRQAGCSDGLARSVEVQTFVSLFDPSQFLPLFNGDGLSQARILDLWQSDFPSFWLLQLDQLFQPPHMPATGLVGT
jgi:hypothetical protein